MTDGRDYEVGPLMDRASDTCEPEPMDAEDPLFILYTSGSTGKPKGVLHTTGGYLVYVALTHEYVFDYHDAPATEIERHLVSKCYLSETERSARRSNIASPTALWPRVFKAWHPSRPSRSARRSRCGWCQPG